MGRWTRWVKWGVAGFAALLLVIQFIPYGRDHANPPVVAEPAWVSNEVRDLAVRACFDCHSNETEWPWYSMVAPMSWLVQNHVDEGREELNFSEWDASQEGDEAAETVRDGSMPTPGYVFAHPDARLSDAELDVLANGFAAMFGEGDGEGHDDDDDDDHDDGDD